MTRRQGRCSRRLSYRRGAGVIIIAALILPAALFALALTSDYGRVVLAIRKCSDVADAVVMAAASVRTDNGELLPANVQDDDRFSGPYWLETYRQATKHGMVNAAYCKNPQAVYLPNPGDGRITSVRVSLTWEVKSMPFVSFFTEDGTMSGTVTRSARICIPETEARACAYPV
jgi:uncharacterized membrane protein